MYFGVQNNGIYFDFAAFLNWKRFKINALEMNISALSVCFSEHHMSILCVGYEAACSAQVPEPSVAT